jgi:hypothetical protein
MARKIPLPVYLMGAGVALMKPLGRAWEHGREAFTDLTPPKSSNHSERYVRVAHGSSESTLGGVTDKVTDLASDMRDAAQHAYKAAAEMASDLPRRVSAMSNQTGANPLLLGALGLAASAAVAAAMPRQGRPPLRHARMDRQRIGSAGSHKGARAAVLQAYGAARREALASGASVTEAERIARGYVQQMGGRRNQASSGRVHRPEVRQNEEWIE